MLTRFREKVPDPAAVCEIGPRLYTIGYEGYSQHAYVRALADRSVTVLCDLRRNAVSRKTGFARQALSEACARQGIRYEHLWQLGVAAEHRRGRKNASDRALLIEDFRLRVLPNQEAVLQQIHAWLLSGERVALSCFERSPAECHRSCVAEQLHRTFGAPCTPLHL